MSLKRLSENIRPQITGFSGLESCNQTSQPGKPNGLEKSAPSSLTRKASTLRTLSITISRIFQAGSSGYSSPNQKNRLFAGECFPKAASGTSQ
ncbi:MAG: hypothetical protein ACKON9_22085, partial [Planctomycetaceae bacterium]